MPSLAEINARAKLLLSTGKYGNCEALAEAAKQLKREEASAEKANRDKPAAKDVTT